MTEIRNKIKLITKELNKTEYCLWWLLRFLMTAAAVYKHIKGPVYERNLILLNLLATFAVPLIRLISPGIFFTSRLTLRTQSYIDIFIFLGSFLGHGFGFLSASTSYDKLMHIAAGGAVVFIGYELTKTIKGGKTASPGIITFAASGFSFAVIVMWELMEFFADYFIKGSCNQAYDCTPLPDMIFFKIFGISKNAAQWPLYDTNIDMFYAALSCIICTAILYTVLKKKNAVKTDDREIIKTSRP